MLFQHNISDRRFRGADYDQIHFFAFVTNLQPRLFVKLRHFRPHAGDGDLQFAVVRRDFLFLDRETLDAFAVRFDHADQQRNPQYTEHDPDIADDQSRGSDSDPPERAARFANLRTSDVTADHRGNSGEKPATGEEKNC